MIAAAIPEKRDRLQFSRDVPIGSELQVNATTDGDQGDPALARKIPDNVVIAWTSEDQDGGDEGVFARLFVGDRAAAWRAVCRASQALPKGPLFDRNPRALSAASIRVRSQHP